MILTLVVKGDRHTASLAAVSRGIPFLLRREVKAGPDRFGPERLWTIGQTTEAYLPQVAKWFVEPRPLRSGFGYPLGSLLHYSILDATLDPPASPTIPTEDPTWPS